MVRWVLCKGGYSSASFFYKAGECQRNQRCFGRIDISLYLSIGESLYSAFGTAMGIWVEAKLVSQVIPSVSPNDWTEKHRQASGHGRPGASHMYVKPAFSSYMICDNTRYCFPLQSWSLMSLHHNGFKNIASIEVWALHVKKRERELKDHVEATIVKSKEKKNVDFFFC